MQLREAGEREATIRNDHGRQWCRRPLGGAPTRRDTAGARQRLDETV